MRQPRSLSFLPPSSHWDFEACRATTRHKWKLQQEVKQRAMHLRALIAVLRYRAPSARKTTSLLHSFLTYIPAALLCFGSLREENEGLREKGKGQGHRHKQHRAEMRTAKPGHSAKVEDVLQQCWCLSHFRFFSYYAHLKSQSCSGVIPAELSATPECFGQNEGRRTAALRSLAS